MRLIFTLEGGSELAFNVYERSISIGRSSNCRIVLPFETFSRQHCLIEFVDEQIIITDTDSSNGVFINHERIPPQVPTPYRIGEMLKIGTAVVELSDEVTSTKVPLELALNKNHAMNDTSGHLFGASPRRSMFVDHSGRRSVKYSNPVAARSSSRKKRESEESESFSLFDPVGILVIVLMLSGYIFYRQKIIKTVKKEPPPYHKPYMVLED